MKKLSYETQIKVCMVLVFGSMLLSLVLRTGLFFKMGVMAYGLLFFINPVLPKKAKVTKYSTLAVRILGAVLIVIGAAGRL